MLAEYEKIADRCGEAHADVQDLMELVRADAD